MIIVSKLFAPTSPNCFEIVREIINVQNKLIPVQDAVSLAIINSKSHYQKLKSEERALQINNQKLEIEIIRKNLEKNDRHNAIKDLEKEITKLSLELDNITKNISEVSNKNENDKLKLQALVNEKLELQQRESLLKREAEGLTRITISLKPI